MKMRYALTGAALMALAGAAIVPALAQAPGGSDMQGQGSGTDMGRMGHGMTSHGMMSHGMMSGMMSGGCSGMMQSMNGGGARPNSQWQAHPPSGGSMMN